MDLSKMSDAQFLVHTHERRFDFGEASVFREEFHRRLADSNTMNAALVADRDILATRLRAAEAEADELAELLRDTEKMAKHNAEVAERRDRRIDELLHERDALKARAEAAEKVVRAFIRDFESGWPSHAIGGAGGLGHLPDAPCAACQMTMTYELACRTMLSTPTPTPATGQETTR